MPSKPPARPAAKRAVSKAAKPAAKAGKPAAKAAKRPAPKMEKPDADVLARLDAAMADLPVYRRPMFGTVSWFVEENAQMFAGVWGDAINLRLGEESAEREVAAGRARPFEPMPGRAMREYVLVPASTLRPADYRRWLARALEFTSTLARKKGK